MRSEEYIELKDQMGRIEAMLARLSGAVPVEEKPLPSILSRPAPAVDETGSKPVLKSVHEEGHWILATQGLAAYAAFWKERFKKTRKVHRRSKVG